MIVTNRAGDTSLSKNASSSNTAGETNKSEWEISDNFFLSLILGDSIILHKKIN